MAQPTGTESAQREGKLACGNVAKKHRRLPLYATSKRAAGTHAYKHRYIWLRVLLVGVASQPAGQTRMVVLPAGRESRRMPAESTGAKRMGMTIRSLVAAAIVAGIYAGSRILDGGGIPTTSTPPLQNIEDLPRQLGDWQSEDYEMDPELFKKTGAISVVNRLYTNPAGETSDALHAAVTVFTDRLDPASPASRGVTRAAAILSAKRRPWK